MNPTPIIERAYALAKSGRYVSTAEVEQALRAEGYSTFGQLAGPDLRRRLKELCGGLAAGPSKPAVRTRRTKRSRVFAA